MHTSTYDWRMDCGHMCIADDRDHDECVPRHRLHRWYRAWSYGSLSISGTNRCYGRSKATATIYLWTCDTSCTSWSSSITWMYTHQPSIVTLYLHSLNHAMLIAAAEHLVTDLPGLPASYNHRMYAGYFPVHEKHLRNNGSLFYWFVESQHKPTHDPLLIWLNGGPGCASTVMIILY